MTQSPRKYVSQFTSSTTNRGVEAKEMELGNMQLDTSSQCQESTERSHASGDTGSYLQVVVQKHKKKEPSMAATQTSPRLPVASSPIKPIKNSPGDHPLYVLSHPMLVYNTQTEKNKKVSTVKSKRSFWSKFKDESSPDKVDFYYFERTAGDFLATSDGTYTYTEQFALKISKIPQRIVAEIFSIPQIIASVPVSIFLSIERAVLITVRNILVGSLQIWSDYLFKPVLALVYNAVIQPPLVLLRNIGSGIRDALKPVSEIFGDFIEPAVKVLSAIRLVNVEMRCTHDV